MCSPQRLPSAFLLIFLAERCHELAAAYVVGLLSPMEAVVQPAQVDSLPESSAKRRVLAYEPVDDVVYPLLDFDADSRQSVQDLIRPAARKWAQQNQQVLSNFATPRRLPTSDLRYYTSAQCSRCTGCYQLRGTAFRFECSVQERHWVRLLVGKAGECNGEPRESRLCSSSKKDEKKGATPEERLRVIAAADSILRDNMIPTPTAVAMRLEPKIASEHIQSILRWRRRVYGKSTEALRESEADFEEYSEKWRDPRGCPLYLTYTLRAFSWLAILTPFLLELARLNAAGAGGIVKPFSGACCRLDYCSVFMCINAYQAIWMLCTSRRIILFGSTFTTFPSAWSPP